VNQEPPPRPVSPAVAWMRREMQERLAKRRAMQAQNAPEATKAFAQPRLDAQN
jgi:hypothetical protein